MRLEREWQTTKRGQKATVQMLDYSERSVEFSVLYYSDVWEELEFLIEDPRRFFRMIRREYDIFTPKDIVDRLNRKVRGFRFASGPITGIFLNAKGRPERWSALERENESGDIAGTFLAEFTINTRTIVVTYLPPKEEDIRKDRYKAKDLSNLVLAFPHGAPQPASRADNGPEGAAVEGMTINSFFEEPLDDQGARCSFHADLATGEEFRRDFVMSYLEDPANLASVIQEHAHTNPDPVNRSVASAPGNVSLNRTPSLISRPFKKNGVAFKIPDPIKLSVAEASSIKYSFAGDKDNDVRMIVVEDMGGGVFRDNMSFGCVHCANSMGHAGDHTNSLGQVIMGPPVVKGYADRSMDEINKVLEPIQ